MGKAVVVPLRHEGIDSSETVGSVVEPLGERLLKSLSGLFSERNPALVAHAGCVVKTLVADDEVLLIVLVLLPSLVLFHLVFDELFVLFVVGKLENVATGKSTAFDARGGLDVELGALNDLHDL